MSDLIDFLLQLLFSVAVMAIMVIAICGTTIIVASTVVHLDELNGHDKQISQDVD